MHLSIIELFTIRNCISLPFANYYKVLTCVIRFNVEILYFRFKKVKNYSKVMLLKFLKLFSNFKFRQLIIHCYDGQNIVMTY